MTRKSNAIYIIHHVTFERHNRKYTINCELLGPVSISAARCVAWRAIVVEALAIADCRSPRNATRSRNGNRPLHVCIHCVLII